MGCTVLEVVFVFVCLQHSAVTVFPPRETKSFYEHHTELHSDFFSVTDLAGDI